MNIMSLWLKPYKRALNGIVDNDDGLKFATLGTYFVDSAAEFRILFYPQLKDDLKRKTPN